jgi:hypothetical protein
MVVPRSALGLLLAGSTGLTLVGVGVTGLSGLDPTLQQAAADVQQQRLERRPVVPDVAPVAPQGDPRHQLVDCPEDRTPAATPGEV